MTIRYRAGDLRTFAYNLLCKKGMQSDLAGTVANVLLEGDPRAYHAWVAASRTVSQRIGCRQMTPKGDPEIVQDHGMSVLWNGCYLPGPWLVTQAIDTGFERLQTHPIFTASIKQCHHIACLEAYLERVAEKGHLIIMTTSDPTLGSKVSPFGGLQ